MLTFKGIAEDDAERVRRHFLRKDKAPYFDVTPLIHPAGVPSTVTIRGKKNYIELQGTYLVMVVPYYEYEYIPFEVYHDKIHEVEAKDGALAFDYLFESEQMYRIVVAEKVEDGLALLLKTAVYAVDKDLYSLTPYIGDLHCHTIHSDGIESPESVVESAIKCKLDFIAVTDHNNYNGSALAADVVAERQLPITVINGEEYSSTFTNMHIISLGASKPLDDAFYNLGPTDEERQMSAAELTRRFCEEIHRNGGVSVMCHPLWKPFHADGHRIDVPVSLVKELLEDHVFDAVEVVSGSPDEDVMTTHMQYILANSFGATPECTAYLGSTDSHTYSIDPICGKHFTMVFAETNSQEKIIEAIRNKRTVAVHIVDSMNALCYGSPRYCMYAQYCLKHIFKKIV